MSVLASYVEKYILNPASSKQPNIEDDGNEETRALIANRVEGEEGAKAAFATVSKLRLQNAELLGDTDPRYKGQKITRKSIKGKDEVSFDPELAKFCMIDEEVTSEESDEDDGKFSKSGSDDEADDTEGEEEFVPVHKNALNENNSLEDDFMRMAEDDEEYSDKEEGSDEEDFDDESNEYDDGEEEKLCNDVDDEDEELLESSSNIAREENYEKHSSVQTFSTSDSVQVSKGIAVKNQCHIFDKLFETRIGLQKVASISNQLPQTSTYKAFLKNEYYPLYKANLIKARKSVKKLILQILELQECILQNNSETEDLLSIDNEHKKSESDKEFEKSDEDEMVNGESVNERSRGTKRKLEEFEEILQKRHKNMIPFRDHTLNTWHEKSKLLVNQSKSSFGKFEISPTVQIKNILANKDQLVKRTQLKGMTRGNVCKVLGKESDESSPNLVEEFDPEIFDDSDFYSRMLEDFLKSKISVSDNMTEVSMHWVGIQKLRKKSKRKVDVNASKGRKLRHEIITKQQHFMAPSKHSVMSDEATNKLYTSLFGNNTVK